MMDLARRGGAWPVITQDTSKPLRAKAFKANLDLHAERGMFAAQSTTGMHQDLP